MDEGTKQRIIASSSSSGSTILHDLCINQDWGEVKSCLKVFDGSTAKIPNADGDLPIHVALANSCPQEIASSLIDAYPEGRHIPSKRNNQYPLLLALKANSSKIYTEEFITSLITEETAKGLNTFGESALLSAISANAGGKVIKTLLVANPDAVKQPDEVSENLPLHEAVEKGEEEGCDVEIIQMIYDAYPDAANIENGTGELINVDMLRK